MEDLVLSCLESRVEENRNLYARFLVGPFLKGEALTVATALRRVLLSSIESIGITALYIQGITHEFSTIVGVRESVLELSLNFGAIVLSYDKTFFQKKGFFDKLQIGYLQIQGPKVVYANHLKLPLGVKLVDPTQYIATVSKEGSIVLKFVIGKRNNSLYQNTGSESHFGDQTKDFSIVGEVGKRNIAKAKKKHSYKNGSTIEPFHQLKPCKSAFVRLQSKAVRPSGHKQAELSFDLPILSGGVRHSRDMSKLFVEQLKKQTFDNISLHRSSWQGHCKESSTSHAKRSKGVAKTTLRFVTPLLHKILFRKSFKKSSQKIGFAQPLLSNLFEGKASSTGVKSRTRTCTLSSLRKTSVFEGKKPCFSLFFPCVQNPANKSSYKSYTSKALNKAFTRRTNTNLCPEQSLYKAMLCKALLGQRFVRSFVCLVSKTELCTGNTITNPLAKQSFALVLQRLLLRSKSMFCTSFVNQRPCMKNHSFATLLQSKGVQSLAKHRYKAFERNWKTVERKSDSLKGDLVFLNEQLQKKKERKTKKTEIKQRRLNFLSSNNVFRSDVCLRNVIPLDLTLNPVLKVNFVVEIDDEVLYLRQKIRERIILEVWTNGSIHPRQAVHDSSLRLLDMFASFRSIYQVASA